MSVVIKSLVNAKIFHHSEIISLMRSFEYGPNDTKNKPIAVRKLNQFKIIGTGSQNSVVRHVIPRDFSVKIDFIALLG